MLTGFVQLQYDSVSGVCCGSDRQMAQLGAGGQPTRQRGQGTRLQSCGWDIFRPCWIWGLPGISFPSLLFLRVVSFGLPRQLCKEA